MEVFSNIGSAKLNNGSTMTSSQTSITVNTEVNVPTVGTFRAIIDNEIVQVTLVVAHVWTIVRADGGTTAASHADATAIAIIVTKEALDALVSIQQAGTEISNRRVLNFVSGAGVADNSGSARADITVSGFNSWNETLSPVPAVSAFTWVNQGGATAVQAATGKPIFLKAPATSSQNCRILAIANPTAPWTLITKWRPLCFPGATSDVGLVMRDSVSGKIITYHWNTNVVNLQSNELTSPTAFSSNILSLSPSGFMPDWYRITDDATNRTYYYSHDGQNWLPIFTTANTTFVSTNQVGFYADTQNSSHDATILMASWDLHSGTS